MKTTYTPEDAAAFLTGIEGSNPATISQLTEGHMSQAFSFEAEHGNKFVLRIANKREDFDVDKYASDTFGSALHVPRVTQVGELDAESYYCISEFIPGLTSNLLDQDELQAALPSIQQSLAEIFCYDISATSGYGQLDSKTGNGEHSSYKSAISKKIEDAGVKSFRRNAENIGLNGALADTFFDQLHNNLEYTSEVRRLIHGDPAFDNMLIEDGKVTAVIDWAQMGYGDWASDFSRLDFWWPGRYGDIKAFAKDYDLEAENLDKRIALYWAANALWAIEFADKTKSDSVSSWLREHLEQRVI